MKRKIITAIALPFGALFAPLASAQEKKVSYTHITNVTIFDGAK